MSITNVDSNPLQLSEYVDDLPINSNEKLNFKVRVCCLFLSPVLIDLFLNEVKLTILFFHSLQLPKYVVNLTTKSDEKGSDEKLNLEVRVSCLFLSPVLIELFSNEVR